MARDRGLQFEHTMRLLFRDKAQHLAGIEANSKDRRDWLKKALKTLIPWVDKIETTNRHKKMIMREIESLSESITKSEVPSWETVYCFYALTFRLFGFDFSGVRCHTPAYWQVHDQRFSMYLCQGEEEKTYHEEKDAISIREKIFASLKKQGVDDYKIALALRTSEYEVKKIYNGAAK